MPYLMQFLKLIRYEKLYKAQSFLAQENESTSSISTAYPKRFPVHRAVRVFTAVPDASLSQM